MVNEWHQSKMRVGGGWFIQVCLKRWFEATKKSKVFASCQFKNKIYSLIIYWV